MSSGGRMCTGSRALRVVLRKHFPALLTSALLAVALCTQYPAVYKTAVALVLGVQQDLAAETSAECKDRPAPSIPQTQNIMYAS